MEENITIDNYYEIVYKQQEKKANGILEEIDEEIDKIKF